MEKQRTGEGRQGHRGLPSMGTKRVIATVLLVVGIIASFTGFIQDNAQRISSQN